jgi:amino acid transporter
MNVALKKVLKLRTVISTAAGMAMATSCYLAGLQIAVIVAGELAWISILIAGLLCLLSAICFSELTALYPSAAGIKLFMENAFNEKTAIAIGMFYVILGASMVGAESYLLSSVLIDSAGIMISPSADRFFWQIIFIFAVGYINYRGIKITGWTQDVLTYVMFGFLIFVSLYTLSVKDINFTAALSSPDFTAVKVLSAAAVGVFMYVGFEWVAPLAEETEDYRMIGKGMLYAVGLLSVTYSLFVVAMYSGLTEEQLKSGTTIPHILFARNLFGTTGGSLFILMSIIASVTSFNAGLLNTSRFTYAMARDNTLPRFFSRLHPDYATPWAAILSLVIFATVLSFIILITGKYLFIIIMAAALECFIYVVMAVCVLRLRKKFPDKKRSFTAPFGKAIPVITAVFFGGLMIGIFADSTKDYTGNILFENFWVAIAMAAFAIACILYSIFTVPRLKAAASERASLRKKRRPGKS